MLQRLVQNMRATFKTSAPQKHAYKFNRRAKVYRLTRPALVGLMVLFGALVLPVIAPQVSGLPVAAAQVVGSCTIPTSPSILGGDVTLSSITINGVDTRCASVEPGGTLNLSFNYFIKDPECPSCIDHIQIGYSNLPNFDRCVYSGIPGPSGVTGSAAPVFTAPATPGTYYLAFDRAQDYTCGGLGPNWWTKPPVEDDAYRFAQIVVNAPNSNWVNAIDLSFTPGGGQLRAQATTYLTEPGGSRWYRFRADSNSKVFVLLNGVSPATTLPFTVDLSLHRDIQLEYNKLTSGSQNPVLLTAQAAPSEYLPSEYLPSEYLPSEYLPSEYLPSEYLPSEYLPSEYLGADFINNQVATEATRPASYQPEAYSGALKNSLVALSAGKGTAPQYISRNTRNTAGYYYVRIKSAGASSNTTPVQLDVVLDGGTCTAVNPVAGTPSYPNAAGTFSTVIVTDYGKLPGTEAEKTALKQRLESFRARPEVRGTVLDLAATNSSGSPLYPRIIQATQTAQNNLDCPLAKNLQATEIKSLIDSYAPTYIVLIGADDVIPFYRYPDQAGLGQESEYVPPVQGNGGAASALFQDMVLGQDFYGSRFDYNRSNLNVAIPAAAVGRLVETASDATNMLNAYISANGVVAPKSALVTGYSFVTSLGNSVKNEFTNSINAPGCGASCLPVDSLISENWSANDLRAKLLNKSNDLVFLGAHFSAGAAEAADRSLLLASEFASSSTNYTNSLILSVGCHSGYNIAGSDNLAGYSPSPDWPRAFAQKGATAVLGTGYQYGDTEIIEYSARLYNELTVQLHTRATPYTGTGPITTSVPLGQALVQAKNRYLAGTTPVTGMHAKVLTVATLYGLPMLKVTLTGRDPQTDTPDVAPPTSVGSGPGTTYNLKTSNYPLNSIALTNNTVTLTDSNTGATQTASYLSGRNGVVANPLEPINPLELRNVSVTGNTLRGVGFVRGTYSDTPNVFPLVAQPEFDQGRARATAGSSYFYPVKPWSINYFDTISNGTTRLAVMPAQYKSDALGSLTGTRRQYNSMSFKLYYSDNLGQAVNTAPLALSDVKANVTTDSGGLPQISFQARTMGETGTQEVWVTYTGLSGAWYGKWESLFLTRSTSDPTLWIGNLPLGGMPVEAVRFMAQAANGSGLVTLATNDGNLFGVAPATPRPSLRTFVGLSGLPASAPAKGTFPNLQATLTDENGQLLADKTILFSLGSQLVSAKTNSSGVANLGTSTPVRQTVGSYVAYAYFKGDSTATTDYQAASSASGQLSITKQTTSLTLSTPPAVLKYGYPTSLTAMLRDSSGAPLSQKSVVFVATSSAGGSYGGAVTTDTNGQAKLGVALWPVGSYTIQAYFATGTNGTIADDQYAASSSGSVSMTITQADSTSAVTASPPVAQLNQPVVLNAKVSPIAPGLGVPTGQVTFKDGATTLGTASLTNSQASLTVSTLSLGNHPITISYAGDTNFTASSSSPVTVTIVAAPTITYPIPPTTNVTPTKATLNGTVNGNYSALTALAFKWGTNATTLSNTVNISLVPPATTATPVSTTLSGLQPNTTYYYQIVATNGAGTTTGNVVSFRTAINLTSYNILTLGTLSFGGGQVEGTIAVGGNGSFSSFSLATNVPLPAKTLTVNGNLTLGAGTIYGDALYGGTLSQSQQTSFRNGRAIATSNPLELVNTTAYAQSVALAWKNLGGTPVTSQYSNLSLTATGSGVKAFAVSGTDLAGVRNLKITAPSGVTVVVNVSGTAINLSSLNVNFQGGIDAAKVVFNFYEATNLNLSSANVQGTLWLPNATATISSSNVTGGLIAKNLTANSLNVRNAPFTGLLPL